MNKNKRRSFGGKISGFDNKQERRFETKHLEAYLRGDKVFQYGFTINAAGNRKPAEHYVKEIWS